MIWQGEEGRKGYLKHLAVHHPAIYGPSRLVPHELNARIDTRNLNVNADVRYRSFEEVRADMRAVGYTDEKIEYLIEDLRPKNKVAVVANAEPKKPMETPAVADAAVGEGDYLDEDGNLRSATGELRK